MTNFIGYHNVEKSIQHKILPARGDRMLPQANILAAASYVRQIFESKKLAYSILGGFQMFCLGNGREVSELHFAYEDKDFNRIRKKIESDRRLRSPEGMNPLTPSKILVQTGPSFQDVGCSSPATVEVYLLPSGSYGTPHSGTLKDNVVLLSNNFGGILRTFKGLNMVYLVRSLIEFCKLRNLSWNPSADVLFLCQSYGGQVQSAQSHLDQKATYNNFLSTPFVASLPFNEQRRCYQILAGQAPPPPPAITPISLSLPLNGQPWSQSAYGPPNPLPNTNHLSSLPKIHCMNNFETLQQMQKEKPAVRHSVNVGLPSRSPPSFSASPEITAPTADPRASHRPISAYNAKRISSGPQLWIDTSTGPFGGSYAHRNIPAPLQNSVPPPPPPQQSVTNFQPSVPFSPLPSSLSIQNRPSLKRSDAIRPKPPRTSYIPHQTLACKPIIETQNPQQQHQTAVFEMPATPTKFTHAPAHTETRHEHQKEEQRRLQVVGPNGLYQSSSSPPLTLHPPAAAAASTHATHTVPAPQHPVYELDSMPAETTEDKDIIASLSANIESAMFPFTNTSNPLTSSTDAAPAPDTATRNTLLPTSLVPGHADKYAQRPYTPPSEKGCDQEAAKQAAQPRDDEFGFSHRQDTEEVELPSPPLTPAPLAVYKAYQPPPLSLSAQARSRSASRSPPVYDAIVEKEQQEQASEDGHDREIYYPNVLRAGRGSVEAIMDPSILAMEYQAVLPDFEHGYAEH